MERIVLCYGAFPSSETASFCKDVIPEHTKTLTAAFRVAVLLYASAEVRKMERR
jgi:hypothetical protein